MIPDTFSCRSHIRGVKGCTYTTDRMENLLRHEETCTDQAKITSKQTAYGGKEAYLQDLINGCWLPPSYINYRNTKFLIYDIETMEECPADFINNESREDRPIQAYLKLATIATSSNMESIGSHYFERKSSKLVDWKFFSLKFMDF